MKCKKIFVMQVMLLLTFWSVLGVVHKAEAQFTLPTSIHDILTPEKIAELKELQQIKDIKVAKRAEVLADTSANIFSMTNPLRENIKNLARGQIGAKMMTLLNAEVTQKISFSDPNNPNGLAARIAPADAELFQ